MLIIFLQEHLHTIYLKNTKIKILQNYNNYIKNGLRWKSIFINQFCIVTFITTTLYTVVPPRGAHPQHHVLLYGSKDYES